MTKWSAVVTLRPIGNSANLDETYVRTVEIESDGLHSDASSMAMAEAERLANAEGQGPWMAVHVAMTPIDGQEAKPKTEGPTTYEEGDVHISWIYDKYGNIYEPWITINTEGITVTVDSLDYTRGDVPGGMKRHLVRRMTSGLDTVIVEELLNADAEV